MSIYTKVMDKLHSRLNLWMSHGGNHRIANSHELTLEGELKVVIDSIRGLKQEMERAENDAIRYRALRRAIVMDNHRFSDVMEQTVDGIPQTEDEFDRAVDAAIIETSLEKVNGHAH